MKALTLHEPWASLIAYGWKEVETRGWYTGYRGPLAIHAANRKPDPGEVSRITFLLGHRGQELPPLSFGAGVCVCQLAACIPTRLVELSSNKLKPEFAPRHGWPTELFFGNYDSGRWAWILRDVRRLERPFAASGQRRLWTVDKALESQILAATAIPPRGVTPPISTAPASARPIDSGGVS